jgi:hypothetical protein
VPESTPAEESVKPAGNVPELLLYVYGLVPPPAVIVTLYAVPTVPLANGSAGDSVIVPQAGVTAYCRVPEQPAESVASTVKVAGPPAVGVPEITPAELIIKPAGKLPLLIAYVYGPVPPLAVIV